MKEEYCSLLGLLPLTSPTHDALAKMCPHLEAEEAIHEFTQGSGYVACPALHVRGCYHILAYRSEWVDNPLTEKARNHPSSLVYLGTGRIPGSYCKLEPRCTFEPISFADRSIAYPESNWGEDLVSDTWSDVMQVNVQDPSDLVTNKYLKNDPRTKAVLYLALSRDYNDLIDDHSKPQSELFDDAIVDICMNRFWWQEMRSGRNSRKMTNCAICGAGFEPTSCVICHHSFRYDDARDVWPTPLSQKMVHFLEDNGHRFGMSPNIAWEAEWATFGQNRIRDDNLRTRLLREFGS